MVGFIKSQLPQKGIDTFVDAFGGGFNVGININARKIIYNDINPFVEGLIRSFYTDPCSYLQYIERQIKNIIFHLIIKMVSFNYVISITVFLL